MGFFTDLFAKPRGLEPLKPAGGFSSTGVVVSVPGGTTTRPGSATLTRQALAMGASGILERWFAHVVDTAGADQVYFQLCRNGFPISGYERIPGVQFDNQGSLEINENVYPGEISIVAYNISGMSIAIEANAVDLAIPVQCQGGFSGKLLSARGGY